MRRTLAAAALALAACSLVACASGPEASESVETPEATRNAVLPTGVTVDVYQTRTDLPARKLEIAIMNAGADDLTITSAAFVSPQFSAPAVWSARPGGTIVHGGFGVDLPVQLPTPACGEPNPVGVVRLAFTTAAGESGDVELPAVDRYDRLPAMRADECFAAAIASVAGLSIRTPPRVELRSGVPVAMIDVTAVPTGADGVIGIDAVRATVLLGIADAGGAATTGATLDVAIAGSDPPTAFSVPIVPGRCDPHAVAEDKQGTIFLFDATAPDGTRRELRIPAASEVRAAIYAYVAEACGY